METAAKLFPVYTHQVAEVDTLKGIVDRLAKKRKVESGLYDEKYLCLVDMQIRLAKLRILLTHPKQDVVRLEKNDFDYLRKVCTWVKDNVQ